MSLLLLPVEIITTVLGELNLQDLLICRETCRCLDDAIETSSRLQYSIELQVAGMLDNPRCKLPVANRLEMLKKREDAWGSLQHDFTTTLKVARPSSGLYDVTPDVYFLGIADETHPFATSGLQSVRLPSASPDRVATSWTEFDLNKEIVDFGTAIDEHDLLAVLTITPDSILGQDCNLLEINLLRYSTGEVHELAEQPVIPVDHVGNLTSISIEICGENLCLIIISNLHPTHQGQLCVYNWMKGTQKGTSISTYNLGLVFLQENLFLTPNVFRKSLDIYCIPPSTSRESDDIQLVRCLRLPGLALGHQIISIQCRCDPNPTAGNRIPRYIPEGRPFVNNPEDAIMVLSVDIQQFATLFVRPFVMLVHRRSLLGKLPENWIARNKEEPVDIIKWSDWGPSTTRWLNADEFATVFITSTAGQRFVRISASAPEISHHIYLLDFNPYHVKKAKSAVDLYPRVDKVVSGGANDSEDDQKCKSFGTFSDNIVSTLPYIQLSSDDYFDFEAVLIDQERIIGIKSTPHTVAVDTIKILHYG